MKSKQPVDPLKELDAQIAETTKKLNYFQAQADKGVRSFLGGGPKAEVIELKAQLEDLMERRRRLESQTDKAAPKATDSQKVEAEKQRLEIESKKAHREAMRMENEGQSKELIAIKEQEAATLKAMSETQNAEEMALYQQKLEIIRGNAEERRALELEQEQIDAEQRAVINEQYLAKDAEFQALDDEQKALFREQNMAQLQSQIMTEDQVRRKAIADKNAQQIQANNQYLSNQQKFGTAYAEIYRMMHSEIFQGTKQAFGEMAQFQSSSNNTLKGIGKAAAIANVAIKTAESAMNIYAGFSVIPIVGQALGVAGAIAAVAFGAEQISRINAAADGALVEGGTPGVDSVPFMLQRGELVVPRKNYNEVVTAVADRRNANKGFSDEGQGGMAQIVIGFDGSEAEQVLTARQVEARALGIIREA